MTDTLTLPLLSHLETRRTVPSLHLKEPFPDETVLERMLAIAVRVPDHGKLAPWRFIHYSKAQGENIGDFLAKRWAENNPDTSDERLDQERTRFLRAPLVVGIISKPYHDHKIPVFEQELSAGAVCLNLMHAAHAFGFSAQWLTEWYSFDEKSVHFLGIEKGERFAGFIHIGTPVEAPVERARPDVSKILTQWTTP